MVGAQPHNAADNDHLDDLLAEMADGWPADMFTQRADMDIAMFHRAIVTKACHVRAEGDGVADEEVVLQVPLATQPGTREHSLDVTIGSGVWRTRAGIKKLTPRQAGSSLFLRSGDMLQMLATLMMMQVLRAGDSVFSSLLGVFQGAYSGAQHADGILKLSEISYCLTRITDGMQWLHAVAAAEGAEKDGGMRRRFV